MVEDLLQGAIIISLEALRKGRSTLGEEASMYARDGAQIRDTDLHRGNLRIYSGSISRLANSKVEQGKQAEHVGQSGVQSVIIGRVVIADVVQFCN